MPLTNLYGRMSATRRTEVNDDEHSLFMALRTGRCYV